MAKVKKGNIKLENEKKFYQREKKRKFCFFEKRDEFYVKILKIAPQFFPLYDLHRE